MEKNLREVVSRLEKVERELEELKGKTGRPTEKEGEQGPPPYVEKIEKILKDELEQSSAHTEDLLVLAAFRKEGGKVLDGLSLASRGEPGVFEPPKIHETIKQALDILQTLSNENRLHILVEAFMGGRYPKELTSVTGLEGGALYHHLDVLTEAGFIERDEHGKIVLTSRGKLLTNLISILSRIKQLKFKPRETER